MLNEMMISITFFIKRSRYPGLLGLLLTISQIISGQSDFRPGYVINNNLDTINGFIDYRGDQRNSNICIFKKSKDSISITYAPTDISGFRFLSGKYYVSRKVKTAEGEKLFFLEYLVNGIVDLFYYRDRNGDFYLLEDTKGDLYSLEHKVSIVKDERGIEHLNDSKKYIGLLKAVFRDCPEINNEVNSVYLDHKSLIKVTKDYHNYLCNDEKCIVYEKTKVPATFRIIPYAGVDISYLKMKGNALYSSFNFKPSICPEIGLMAEVNIPKLNERLFFQANIGVGQRYFYSYNEDRPDNFSTHVNEIHISQVFLEAAFAFKYSMPLRKCHTFFYGGLIAQQLISESSRRDYKLELSSGSVYPETYYDVPEMKFGYGPYAGIGLQYPINKKTGLFFDINYSSFVVYKIKSNLQVLNLNLGIYF